MRRRLVVRPSAQLDIAEAAAWCDRQGPHLGQRMLHDIDLAVAAIVDNPFLYQVVFGGVRRAPLRNLGYGLFYTVSEEELVVIGFFHGRQNPARLRGWG